MVGQFRAAGVFSVTMAFGKLMEDGDSYLSSL